MAELLFKQERDILILAMDMVNLSTKSTQITLDYNQIHIIFYFIITSFHFYLLKMREFRRNNK